MPTLLSSTRPEKIASGMTVVAMIISTTSRTPQRTFAIVISLRTTILAYLIRAISLILIIIISDIRATKPTKWYRFSRSGVTFKPSFCKIRTNCRPPSRAGRGSAFITARLSEIEATKSSTKRGPKFTICEKTETMPIGPETCWLTSRRAKRPIIRLPKAASVASTN